MDRRTPLVLAAVLLAAAALCRAQQDLPAVGTVAITSEGRLTVNGRPFFPIMLWLQEPGDFPLLKELNHNTVAGYWWDAKERNDANGLAKDPGVVEHARQLWKANLYFVPSFHREYSAKVVQELAGLENLLGYIQGDEPDMARVVSDAKVEPAEGMRLNPSTPFHRLVDGQAGSWTVLDPMSGAEFTIHLPAPVTVHWLAVSQTIDPSVAVAKEVVFLGDGREILKATLANKKGPQKLPLVQPASFRALTVRVLSEYAGRNRWGSIGEVEAFDKEGHNVLLSPPRQEPRAAVEELAEVYRQARQAGGGRPVFMNFTASFMSSQGPYDQAAKDRIYPAYVKHCDVVGFDTYPIYGSANLHRIGDPAIGTEELRAIAGAARPVYTWIETNRGSQWITPSKQPPVRPEHTRFEVWSSIIRGAGGIAYFTHKWKDPNGRDNYQTFAPRDDPAMREELKRLNGQIARLAGAILAPPAGLSVRMKLAGEGGDLPCHLKATRHEGALYLFAQNFDVDPNAATLRQFDPIHPRAGQAVFTVPGLKAGTKIEVLDEDRTITAEDGRFLDSFEPLREHVYRLRLDGM